MNSLVSQYEVFSFLDKTVFLHILFSKFLNICSSLNLINLVARSIKLHPKYSSVYLLFINFDIKRDDKIIRSEY